MVAIYEHTSSYSSAEAALEVFLGIQELVLTNADDELGVYRAQIGDAWVVVTLGLDLPRPLRRRLSRICRGGQPFELPENLRQALWERHVQGRVRGPYWESHYGPDGGIRLE